MEIPTNKAQKENSELVSATNQLKLLAADGKKYNTDTLDSHGVIELAKHFPNNRAMKFLDWFLYSDNSIDGQNKKLDRKILRLAKPTGDNQKNKWNKYKFFLQCRLDKEFCHPSTPLSEGVHRTG